MAVVSFAVDSSCMVAAVSAWHEHHEAAADAIEMRLDRGDHMVVPAHALLETYSVLTRLPAPHRLAPADAWAVIDANFASGQKLVSILPAAYASLIAELAADGVAGGRAFDALIGASASRAAASALLTLNPKHFTPPPEAMAIVDPSRDANATPRP